MKRSTRVSPSALALAPFILSLLAAGCSLFRGDSDRPITVFNRLNEPIVFFLVEQEESHVINLEPTVTTDALPEAAYFVESGRSATVDDGHIAGYRRGDGVRMFLYQVTGDEAHLRTLFTYTDRVLRQNRYRIEIRSFERQVIG